MSWANANCCWIKDSHVLTVILVGLLQQPELSALHVFRKNQVPLGGEIWDTKALNLSRNVVSLQVLGRCIAFFTSLIILSRNKTFVVAGWRNAARWLVDLFGVDPRQVVSLMKKRATKRKYVAQNRASLYFLQQLSSIRNTNICCASWSPKVKNAKYRPKTCNETMLLDKLRVFVSRVSPPLERFRLYKEVGKGSDKNIAGKVLFPLDLQACRIYYSHVLSGPKSMSVII